MEITSILDAEYADIYFKSGPILKNLKTFKISNLVFLGKLNYAENDSEVVL